MFFKVESQEAKEKAYTYIHFCRLFRRRKVKEAWIKYRCLLEKRYKTKKWWADLFGIKIRPFDIPEYSESVMQQISDKNSPYTFKEELATLERSQKEMTDLIVLVEETKIPHAYLEKKFFHLLYVPNTALYEELFAEFPEVEKITK